MDNKWPSSVINLSELVPFQLHNNDTSELHFFWYDYFRLGSAPTRAVLKWVIVDIRDPC